MFIVMLVCQKITFGSSPGGRGIVADLGWEVIVVVGRVEDSTVVLDRVVGSTVVVERGWN